MIQQTTIILADDEILIRKGIKTILEFEDNLEIVFDANNGLELLQYLEIATNLPDIILMDIRMPELNGIEATKKISEKYPGIKIIALSSYTSETFIANMLQVGAVAYIQKNALPTEMIKVVNQVIKNGFYYEDFMLKYISNKYTTKAIDNDFLTNRELEILILICQQKATAEIAEILQISPRTVEGHRNHLLFKTNSKNTVGLVIFAIQTNLFLTTEADFF